MEEVVTNNSSSNGRWEHGNQLPQLRCRSHLNSSNNNSHNSNTVDGEVPVGVPKDVGNTATHLIIIKCIIPTLLDHKGTIIRTQTLVCTAALLNMHTITRIPSILNRDAVLIHQDHGVTLFLEREVTHQLEELVECTISSNNIPISKEGSISSSLHNKEPRNHLSLP